MKKVYVCETEGPRRGRPVVRLKEYMHERIADTRGGIELARRECVNTERRRFFCHGHPIGGRS